MSEIDLTSGADRNPIEMLAEEFVERQRRGELPRSPSTPASTPSWPKPSPTSSPRSW